MPPSSIFVLHRLTNSQTALHQARNSASGCRLCRKSGGS
nr:MAG TPA: hypothetical protein [Caudoviricetes sp.]